MKPGKLARALLFAAAMIGLTGASPLAEAPKPAQNILTESFEINHLDITYGAGGGIHFTVIADSYDGQSQSGLPTEQILTLDQNIQGLIDPRLPDVRVEFAELEFLNPDVSARANVHIVVTTSDDTDNRNLFIVEPARRQRGSPYAVQRQIYTGENINVTINGNSRGNRSLANRIVSETEDAGDYGYGRLGFLIDFSRSSRRITPEDGSTQLRSLPEIMRPY